MTFAMSMLLAVSLSMDSFAVALGRGTNPRRSVLTDAIRTGAAFGLCQSAMPLLGWAVGVAFAEMVRAVDHWIAFLLLLAIGGLMVARFLRADGPDPAAGGHGLLALAGMAVATSIDAAAVGIGLAMAEVDIAATVALIGLTTFGLAFSGVLLGRVLGPLLGRVAELLGGLGLIAVGLNILLEHTLV